MVLLHSHLCSCFITVGILKEVPFDPFLPFVSKGEEILMSSRMWTSGYDFLQPNYGVLGHEYGLHHSSNKEILFWEKDRKNLLGQVGLYNPLQLMMLQRIKFLLKYPEAERDMIKPKSLLLDIDKFGLGDVRSLKNYLEVAGLNVMTKKSDSKLCQ